MIARMLRLVCFIVAFTTTVSCDDGSRSSLLLEEGSDNTTAYTIDIQSLSETDIVSEFYPSMSSVDQQLSPSLTSSEEFLPSLSETYLTTDDLESLSLLYTSVPVLSTSEIVATSSKSEPEFILQTPMPSTPSIQSHTESVGGVVPSLSSEISTEVKALGTTQVTYTKSNQSLNSIKYPSSASYSAIHYSFIIIVISYVSVSVKPVEERQYIMCVCF